MQQALALQKIIYPEGVDILYIPPHPRFWVRPRKGATSVSIIGVSTLPEEFLREAEMYGWKYLGGKFYPADHPDK